MIEEQKLDPKSVPSKSALDITVEFSMGLAGLCKQLEKRLSVELLHLVERPVCLHGVP